MAALDSAEFLNTSFIDQVKGYAIFATDTEGIIRAWNKGAERLKGYTEQEIIGQYYGILHPDAYQEAGKPERELALALQNGVYEAEDWRKRKDGTHFWAIVTLTPIFSAEGHHIGFTKITGDLTKQRELQDRLAERQQDVLEHKNQELKKINLDLDNFIYTASHDLRSPITNIEGLMTLLREELIGSRCLSTETDGLLQRVISSVDRFKRTIEDLTEISRLQKDISQSQPAENVLIKEVYDGILLDRGYPAELSTCTFHTDFRVLQLSFPKKNFRSVLYNLISNAIKYQAPDQPCTVWVRTWPEGEFVVLAVKDNGLGMKEWQLEQLFTMFKRFHDHVEGTGIGLYMVKRIIENAGGRIEVESKLDEGSEFRVYFKADPEAEA